LAVFDQQCRSLLGLFLIRWGYHWDTSFKDSSHKDPKSSTWRNESIKWVEHSFVSLKCFPRKIFLINKKTFIRVQGHTIICYVFPRLIFWLLWGYFFLLHATFISGYFSSIRIFLAHLNRLSPNTIDFFTVSISNKCNQNIKQLFVQNKFFCTICKPRNSLGLWKKTPNLICLFLFVFPNKISENDSRVFPNLIKIHQISTQ